MEGALFDCPREWEFLLPAGVAAFRLAEDLPERNWDLLALTREGCERLAGRSLRCRILLAPGDCPAQLLEQAAAETVISWGMSPRDSLTLSSLAEPVLCVQRDLPRPDGGVVEPQEFPLSALPGPAEELLPLLGIRLLLQMPLTDAVFL